MSIRSRIIRKIRRYAYQPSIKISKTNNIFELGTPYGGWNFVDTGRLFGASIISAGLGEDASFDVQFAAKYGAKVIIVDPTPRAIQHFQKIKSRLGLRAETNYIDTGKQPVEAYDLSKLSADSLVLIEKALWINNEPVKFYQPSNPDHVSHSITNLFNNHSKNLPFIEVPSTTLVEIVEQYGLEKVALLKIDIEGVEVEVLENMLEKKIFPDQILVEFDEISDPSPRIKKKYEGCDMMLRKSGYLGVFCKANINFTYVKSNLVSGAS